MLGLDALASAAYGPEAPMTLLTRLVPSAWATSGRSRRSSRPGHRRLRCRSRL